MNLQLDRAEFDAPASACGLCASPLRDVYFDAGGSPVCTPCAEQLQRANDRGSRFSRITRAVGAGIGAALGGAILYWAILALTGYEFGLIAIVVGYAVGRAVSWGSRGKGGWRYQTLAMALTYLAIVSAYAPLLFTEMRKGFETAKASATTTDTNAPPQQPATDEPELTTIGAVFGLVVFIGVLCAVPFLAGIENILGIIILGFGLYEAWKLNRPVTVELSGPHAIAAVQQT